MSDLIAGFDAGQTHTTCRLMQQAADGSWVPIAEGRGPGVCHLAAADGPTRFQAALAISLIKARQALDDNTLVLVAAGVGASGIEEGSSAQEQGRQLAAVVLSLPPERLVVSGDERAALRGAFPGGEGILMISGTGCIAVGRNAAGLEHRCGGWGWLLDGSGSAMDIGHDALMLSVRMADGRAADTPLRPTLWRALSVSTPEELKAKVVQADFGPAGFAQLAPVIDQLARDGNAEANAIIRESASGLADLVAGVAQALKLTTPPVAAVGGAITHLPSLRRAWSNKLSQQLPGATVVTAQQDACHGALMMALDRLAPNARLNSENLP